MRHNPRHAQLSCIRKDDLVSFSEKTIRWPGHWQAIDTLKECGLLDNEPVTFGGQAIRPRDFFLSRIEPRLRPLAWG